MGPDVVVGVCVGQGVDLVVALLGVWKAGGAYVVLDPRYPVERLRSVVVDAGVGVVVGSSEFVGVLGVGVVSEADGVGLPVGSLGDVGLLPDHAAYVMYTSGSSGRAKGVVVTHRDVLELLGQERVDFVRVLMMVWGCRRELVSRGFSVVVVSFGGF